MRCSCGIPNRANYHTEVIVGRPGETSDVQIYTCAAHTTEDVLKMLRIDGKWEVLKFTQTHLRGER